MGKDNESSALLLGGGKENIAADGVTPIGRTYTVQLFGEDTTVGEPMIDKSFSHTR